MRPFGPSVTLTVLASSSTPVLQQPARFVVEVEPLAHAFVHLGRDEDPAALEPPLSRSAIASLMASSGYVLVCSATLPCAVSVIRSCRST